MDPSGTTRLSFVQRLRNRGDKRVWAEFHERYGELLYRYARRLGASHTEAEDVVQEVEMYLFKAMEGFEYDVRKGRFRGYLRSAVVHQIGRRAAKRARQEVVVDPRAFDALAHEDASRDADWEHEERLHRIRWAMRAIAGEFEPVTLEAFRLHVLIGWPVAETADRLGLHRDSVYQAKCRVLRRLREWINTADADGDEMI